MPRLNAANNAETTLASAISSSSTSLTVASGAAFPAAPFLISIDDEIIEVGAKNGNTFSDLLRGREGTTAASHNQAAKVENRFTAGMHDDLRTYLDLAESGDFLGVKYRLVVIDGEAYLEVIEA